MSEFGTKEFLNRLLATMVQVNASDLYLKAEAPPTLRIEGQLSPIEVPPLLSDDTQGMAYSIMPEEEQKLFPKTWEANFVYAPDHLGRFRVNVYLQRDSVAMVIRRIRDDILEFDKLGLPSITKEIALYRRGMVLVTGATGSGKSTTLATMIHYRNQHPSANGHILTVEDPIEFVHHDINCIISQREVGSDTRSFKVALINAMRQAPDVLLVGEMRDIDSVKTGVYFAETGHLVLSTLHSTNAAQTIERVLQFFPLNEKDQMLQHLALNLRAVVCQRLIPRKDEAGRALALEILIVNARMRDLLAKSAFDQIQKELDFFHTEGMTSFDNSMIELFQQGHITIEDCIRNSDNPRDMKLKLKKIGSFTHRESDSEEEGV